MKLRVYKATVLLLAAVFASHMESYGQTTSVSGGTVTNVTVTTNFDEQDFKLQMDDLGKNIKAGLKDLSKSMSLSFNGIVPKIKVDVSGLSKDFDFDINPKIDVSMDNAFDDKGDDAGIAQMAEKIKNYSKSYPLNGNDKIKLSNQYGRIIVNTWDKREVKVDVEIKAEAPSDADAQKLMDGVHINNSKSGDLVAFRTDIEHSFNWGGNHGRKIEINYIVYMPARTDLNVEDSYGAITLPNLDGHVKISSSYGSVTAQNLSNAANEIEGSYGSMKIARINGTKLDYSYGSVMIEECNNLKADLSYGSFTLGKLKGVGEFGLSYVGGFKINDLAGSLKKLTIDASYSGVSAGIVNANFDFDITTSYGGFNYNNDKVTVTSKTPPDGSKHVGSTRNYKGHAGHGNSETQVNINTSYGGVNFE